MADSEHREVASTKGSPPGDRRQEAAKADQTDQNILEHNARLIAEVARLTETVAAQDAFLTVAAHELRNPMTPIVGRVQILRRAASKPDFQTERLVRDLDQIEWLILHYLKRATTLLDVSRITSGKLSLGREPVDVCEVAHEVADNFGPMAGLAGSNLSVDLPNGALLVSGDRLAIEEILDNLVSNAIKYGSNKPISLSARVDEEKRLAVIDVSDRGPGIPSANQARIFERFERAVQPGEHLAGFGVGLWIVRQLCEGMGGSVTVNSGAGQGSTFRVALRLHPSREIK